MFGSSNSKQSKPDTFLRVQTSVAGKAITIGWGQTRIPGNLIWYGDFKSQTTGGGGGKGGGGKSGGGSTTYSASVIIGICEGPIVSVPQIWNNATPVSLGSLNLGINLGAYDATPWSYMSSVYPSEALAYRGLANAVAGNMPLGSSSSLPNITFEVQFAINTSIAGGPPDADPALVTADFLTNPNYSIGFPSEFLGDLITYSNYCIANGLVVSPAITDQSEARQFLVDLLRATNSEAVWSGGYLKVVPYGDTTITANGRTYTAPSAPLYSLSDVDFKPIQGSNPNSTSVFSSGDPVQVTRLRPSDQMNDVTIEYLDRSNGYNATVVEVQDDAGINAYGLRKASTQTLHFFCLQSAALMSAQLMLGREAIRNTFAFTVGAEYILLDPMDIIAISDMQLGLVDQWVRITEITENPDGTLTIYAEEYLDGTGSAPIYSAQPALGIGPALNATPTGLATPVIWEPTYALAGATEIWIAMAGTTNFGGCEVWVSTDDETYQIAGTFDGVSRMGQTTSALATIAVPPSGLAIDVANTLNVDMTESGAELASGTQQDAQQGNTVCYLDGEYFAYQTATLVSAGVYALSYLVRGLYDTVPAAHRQSEPVVRLSPGTYFRFPLTVDRIGQQFWFKFLAFNDYGAGQQSLDEVMAYPYTVSGVALAEVLAAPANLTTAYVGAYTYLSWIEVQDFRGPVYEIRKGASWLAAQRMGSVAHPPWQVFGDDTYWVAAVVNPAPGLIVYSTPVSIVIAGSAIVSNILNTWDEAATGWSGTLTGGCVVSGSIVTTSSSGAGQVGGTYEIPTSHEIDVGRACLCQVLINWTSLAYPAGQNILTITDLLAQTDLLGASVAGNASVYPEISVSQDGSTYGGWKRYTPGAYSGRKFRARMQVLTNDPNTTAALTAMTFYVAAPERDDHYLGVSVASGGASITYRPDGSSTATAFNGGPGGASLPSVQATILNASAGDTLVLSGQTLSGCTVQVMNGSSGVSRTVNLLVQGY
jgi:hypothetical protein